MPSFGSSGGGGGVEAGSSGAREPSQEPSDAAQQFDRLARQIGELAREHAGALEQVDQTLSEARAASEGREALRQEAERRAAELRDAVEELPLPGDRPGTARADAALGRQHALAMAHGMESLRLAEAAESGHKALSSLQNARARSGQDPRMGSRLAEAEAELQQHLDWLDQQLDASREAARERAREALGGSAQLEKELAKAAESLEKQGSEADTPLPGEVTARLRAAAQLMRQASGALERGEGEAGLELQREAQRLIERADRGETRAAEGPEGAESERSGDGRSDGFGGEVPDANELSDAEEFRRRVIRNLGEARSGRLGPAIRRYAEGLLR
jgi:hypothetical protein